MLFNSIDFAVFLPLVFALYWFVFNRNIKTQNLLIVIASYVFYGWWEWRFLSLIILSTILDFIIGQMLVCTERIHHRRLLLWTSISINLGLLGYFKYANFFLDNFHSAFTFFGFHIAQKPLAIILPVGISFYTFQTLSYTIDVYRNKLTPTNDFISFSAFVSFFPQLVAGPIERASHLLPQFYHQRVFNYHKAVDGLRQILWGLFKKVLIADQCAEIVNDVFHSYDELSGTMLFFGAVGFSFQIYCDFSGYSDIAIGTARLFGFDLMQNFNYPYFSRNIAEFWRRWHISLSTWFRDYLYIPLGGSSGNMWRRILNTLVIFIVSGFWHGAKWTFIVWGAINAIFFIPLLLMRKNRKFIEVVAHDRLLPTMKEILQIGATFILTSIAWVFFRAESVAAAFAYIIKMIAFLEPNYFQIELNWRFGFLFVFIPIMLATEWLSRKQKHGLAIVASLSRPAARWAVYFIIICLIFIMNSAEQEFIYFQF